jgi:hypothetical protein
MRDGIENRSRVHNLFGLHDIPSLKTVFGRQDIENDAAASNVGSSCFPKSVRVYSIRIMYVWSK